MRNNLTQANADHVPKTTSLIYLKEALLAQRYEDCAELVREARELGAQPSEVNAVIAEYIRGDEAKQKKKAPRF